MRCFVLVRDIAGSPTDVAEGVVYTDGSVAIRWLSNTPSTILFNSVDDVVAVHGHGGATIWKWGPREL